ncbi:MAG: FAD-binding protein [Flavobacteriales bacterium]|nr:FAD-binding protein [Flavobacteriales bacterium]
MKILVPFSVVPDIYCAVENYIQQDAVCVDDTVKDVNPTDVLVLSKALSFDACQTTAVYVGDTPCNKSLRYAVALGAKDTRRINAVNADAFCVARHLADFLNTEKYDVIMCGDASWDYSSGCTPEYLSEMTCVPLISDVADVSLVDEKNVLVIRQTEHFIEKLVVPFPVILKCNKSIFPQEKVRIPSMRDMMLSTSAQICVVDKTSDVEPLTHYSSFTKMPARGTVKVLTQKDFPLLVSVLLGEADEKGTLFSSDQVSVFSGRIIATVNGKNEPKPVLFPDNGEKQLLPTHIDLHTAKVVISGGMGCDASAWKKIDFLAEKTGGAVACTRPVYHAGIRSYYEHVGQTGAKISPDVYVAVGISGALQHIGGMVRSRCVVAINTDPNAPIFHYADYGVVGDANAVLDELTQILTKK